MRGWESGQIQIWGKSRLEGVIKYKYYLGLWLKDARQNLWVIWGGSWCKLATGTHWARVIYNCWFKIYNYCRQKILGKGEILVQQCLPFSFLFSTLLLLMIRHVCPISCENIQCVESTRSHVGKSFSYHSILRGKMYVFTKSCEWGPSLRFKFWKFSNVRLAAILNECPSFLWHQQWRRIEL